MQKWISIETFVVVALVGISIWGAYRYLIRSNDRAKEARQYKSLNRTGKPPLKLKEEVNREVDEALKRLNKRK